MVVRDPFGSTVLAVRLAKPRTDDAARGSAWLALLNLGTDLPYDARARVQPLGRHDEHHLR
ncbi:hypothetical protein Pth03_37050 [Planotetraspora thailandica]|uniref:Uncharacterized protein n=1 Tax=Planotetraspora thailandica TaxID=487172 RepID=A0A8J3V240_9ACTN|nr:hypothetical protein Pth03_37050 [Planotetraspora thailandica]